MAGLYDDLIADLVPTDGKAPAAPKAAGIYDDLISDLGGLEPPAAELVDGGLPADPEKPVTLPGWVEELKFHDAEGLDPFTQVGAAGLQGITEMLTGTAKGAAISVHDALRRVGIDLGDPREGDVYEGARFIEDAVKAIAPTNPEYEDSFGLTTVPHGIGSTVGFMVTGLAGRLAGVPAAIGASGTGALVMGAGGFEDAIQHGASLEDAFSSFEWNLPGGATEGVPIGRILDRIDEASGGTIRDSLVRIVKGGTDEAIQEAVQNIWSNIVASDLVAYDPERETFTGLGEAAGAGFSAGSFITFLGELAFQGHRRLRGGGGAGDQPPAPAETGLPPAAGAGVPPLAPAPAPGTTTPPVSEGGVSRVAPAPLAQEDMVEVMFEGDSKPLRGRVIDLYESDVGPGVRLELPDGTIFDGPLADLAAWRKIQGDGTRTSPVVAETAEDVARAAEQVNTEPTDGQKEAGNYKQGHLQAFGLDIAIETPQGAQRTGTGPDGTPWSVTMPATYGRLKRTDGADGEEVDVYVGPNLESGQAFVLDQLDADSREFDEHKVFLGFDSPEQIGQTYDQAFSDGRATERWGALTPLPLDELKAWLAEGDTTAPLAWQPEGEAESDQGAVDDQEYLDKARETFERYGVSDRYVNDFEAAIRANVGPREAEVYRAEWQRLVDEAVAERQKQNDAPESPPVAPDGPPVAPIAFPDVVALLPRDADGSPDMEHLTGLIREAAPDAKAWRDLTPEQQHGIAQRLQEQEPENAAETPENAEPPLDEPQAPDTTEETAPPSDADDTGEPSDDTVQLPEGEAPVVRGDADTLRAVKADGGTELTPQEREYLIEQGYARPRKSDDLLTLLPKGRRRLTAAEQEGAENPDDSTQAPDTTEETEEATDAEQDDDAAPDEGVDAEEAANAEEAGEAVEDQESDTTAVVDREAPSGETQEVYGRTFPRTLDGMLDAAVWSLLNVVERGVDRARDLLAAGDTVSGEALASATWGQYAATSLDGASVTGRGTLVEVRFSGDDVVKMRPGKWLPIVKRLLDATDTSQDETGEGATAEDMMTGKRLFHALASVNMRNPSLSTPADQAALVQMGLAVVLNSGETRLTRSGDARLYEFRRQVDVYAQPDASDEPDTSQDETGEAAEPEKPKKKKREKKPKAGDELKERARLAMARHPELAEIEGDEALGAAMRPHVVAEIGRALDKAEDAQVDALAKANRELRDISDEALGALGRFVAHMEEGLPLGEGDETGEPEAPKAKRRKKMVDVGEEIRRRGDTYRSKLDKATADKDAKAQVEAILAETQRAQVWSIEVAEDATPGTSVYLENVRGEFKTFLELTTPMLGAGRRKWQNNPRDAMVELVENDAHPYLGMKEFPGSGIEWLKGVAADYVAKLEILKAATDNSESAVEALVGLREAIGFRWVDGKPAGPEGAAAYDWLGQFDRMIAKEHRLRRLIGAATTYDLMTAEEAEKARATAKPVRRPGKGYKDITRTGPDRREGRDITEEELKTTFGLRTVAFGDWVTGAEGQAMVNHAFDALHDLADLMGIEAKHIGLNGLALAFGRLGRGGHHAAHYEPSSHIINLTKTSGDGSLSHEWLHALDWSLQKTSNISLEVFKRRLARTYDLDRVKRRLGSLLRAESWITNDKRAGPIETARRYIQGAYWRRWDASSTRFKSQAAAMGSGENNYWERPHELMARAFEAFVYDTVMEAGNVSDFLVNAWTAEGVVSKASGHKAEIYPAGQDRADFAAMFRQLAEGLSFDEEGHPRLDPSLTAVWSADVTAAQEYLDGKLQDLEAAAREAHDEIAEARKPKKDATDERKVDPDRPGLDEDGETGGVPGDGERGDAGGASDGEGGGGAGSEEGGVRGAAEDDAGGEGDRVGEQDGPDSQPGRRDGDSRDVPDTGLVKGTNYRITAADGIGAGGPIAKARANIAAIRLARTIVSERRPATTEEQAVLVRYVGWGGLKSAFDSYTRDEGMQKIGEELKELLTEEEWRAARESTLNAHYTSFEVIEAMWAAMRRLGFDGGRVLEPSAGVGHYLGLAPEGTMRQIKATAVELDKTSGMIAGLLYPRHNVKVQGFETLHLPDGYFDLAISNVPFGDYKLHDPRYNRLKLNIHNYFFVRALDLVRPGGVVAFITSRYTMDAKDSRVRRLIGDKADLLGAVRLPNTAFKGNAGTEVVTDVIFLQKRRPGAKPADEAWGDTETVNVDGVATPLNSYYARHPEMVLGNHSLGGSMYGGNEYTVEADGSRPLADQIADALATLPEGVMDDEASQVGDDVERVFATDEVKEGQIVVHGDRLRRRVNGELVPYEAKNATEEQRIRGLIVVRDKLRAAFAAQVAGREDWKKSLKALNEAYDGFVKKHGFVNSLVNQRAFDDDPDVYLVSALENYDPDAQKATKAPALLERVIAPREAATHADSPDQALALSLTEKGGVDLTYMAGLTGLDEERLTEALAGAIFRNPNGERWETADEYLSGDVVDKLVQARAAAEIDAGYSANVAALEEALPKEVPPHKIETRLGVPWVDVESYAAFAAHLFDLPENHVRVLFDEMTNSWSVQIPDYALGGTKVGSEWAVHNSMTGRGMNGRDLMQAALEQRYVTIYQPVTRPDGTPGERQDGGTTIAARTMVDRMHKEFARWLWSDDARAMRLTRHYNETYNRYAPRRFNGAHLTLPGSNPAIQLRPHQKNAAWRTIVTGNTLYAHVVGAGKTYTAVAAGMEMKRLGLVRKPMYVVPNHMLQQFSREFLQLYPQARIIVADDKSWDAKKRKKFLGRVATGNWDAVIIKQSSFSQLPMSRAYEIDYLTRELADFRAAIDAARAAAKKGGKGQGQDRTIAQIEKAMKRRETKLRELLNIKRDDLVSFEETGVDYIFSDESQWFKNLNMVTRLGNLPGIAKSDAKKASDLEMKLRYLEGLNPGRAVTLMTATPISNTLGEAYVNQRYLQRATLEQAGLLHFDAWASQFGELRTATEPKPDGSGFRVHSRFAKYRNIPMLSAMFNMVSDVVTQEMIPEVKVPKVKGGGPTIVAVPPSQAQLDYIQTLVARTEAIRAGEPLTENDNMLNVTGDGRYAALDLRTVVPGAKESDSAKPQAVADKVHEIWERTKKTKGTQLVFLDRPAPHTKTRHNVYKDLRARMVKLGIPENEIAFIHDHDSDARKDKLFKAVRTGKIRVLFGSSEKMGVGTNVQTKLVALHHIDAAWRPADIEQREGRIIRQGNENEEVEIYRYVTESTFDVYMWNLVLAKAKFIRDFLTGQLDEAGVEFEGDIGDPTLSYAEVTAVASGNPLLMKKTEVDAKVAQLEALRRSDDSRKWDLRQRLDKLQGTLDYLPGHIGRLKDDLAQVKPTKGDAFTMTVAGKAIAARSEAGQQIMARLDAMAAHVGNKKTTPSGWRFDRDRKSYIGTVGEISGFPVEVETRVVEAADKTYRADVMGGYLAGKERHHFGWSDDPLGLARRIENALDGIAATLSAAEGRLARAQDEIVKVRNDIAKPFAEQAELDAALEEQAEIEDLMASGDQRGGPIEPDFTDAPNWTAWPRAFGDFEAEPDLRWSGTDGDDVRYSLPEDGEVTGWAPPPGFFSGLLEGVKGIKQAKAPPSQWAKTILGLPGIRKEELEWTGVIDWLADNDHPPEHGKVEPITRDELVAYIEAHEPVVTEVVRGEPEIETSAMGWKPAETWHGAFESADGQWQVRRDPNRPNSWEIHRRAGWANPNSEPNGAFMYQSGGYNGPEAAQTAVERQVAIETQGPPPLDPKFASYTLPGGKAYRELLLTMPTQEPGKRTYFQVIGAWPQRFETREEAEAYIERWEETARERAGEDDAADQRRFMREQLTQFPFSIEEQEETVVLRQGRVVVDNLQESEDFLAALPAAIRARFRPDGNDGTWLRYEGLTPDELTTVRSHGDDFGAHITERVFQDESTYREGHWPEPNVFAHVRFKERVDTKSRRTLFIEEIQSDWHQMGRKKGYRGGPDGVPYGWTVEQRQTHSGAMYWAVMRPGTDPGDMLQAGRGNTREEAIDSAQDSIAAQTVPDAPFKASWHELAFKRALRWAVEHGFDQVAWTTGEQQAARYDLSRQVDTVDVIDHRDGGRFLDIRRGGYSVLDVRYDDQGVVTDGHQEFIGKPLEAVLGKELADKVLAVGPKEAKPFEPMTALPEGYATIRLTRGDTTDWAVTHTAYFGEDVHGWHATEADAIADAIKHLNLLNLSDAPFVKSGLVQRFEGLDLKIGGAGMIGFYDKMLPAFVNKYAKRWGAKAGMARVLTTESVWKPYFVRSGVWVIRDEDGDGGTSEFPSREAAQAYLDEDDGAVPVHALEITPAMRESVLSGQGLWALRQAGELATTEAFRAAKNEVIVALREEMRRLGAGQMGLRVANQLIATLEDGTQLGAQGRFSANLIEVALTQDPEAMRRVLRHEVIHALKYHGLFSAEEWAVLEGRARKVWMGEFKIAGRRGYRDLAEETQLEEAIAEGFARWHAGDTKASGPVEAIFQRMARFFEALGNALRGQGFQTWASIFQSIEAGQRRIVRGDLVQGGQERHAFLSRQEAEAMAAEAEARTGFVHLALPMDPYQKAGKQKKWVVQNRFVPVTVGGDQFTPAQKAWQDDYAKRMGGRYSLGDGQTERPAFKRWFGKSVMIDGEGNPRVHYHITRGDFTEFKPGGHDVALSGPAMWFTPNRAWQQAAHNTMARGGDFVEGANVMPVYLKVERPLWLDDPQLLAEATKMLGEDARGFPFMVSAAAVKRLKAAGHDGIVYAPPGSNVETGEKVEVVVFEPTQIKSATGNTGAFDPANPDIRYSLKDERDAADLGVDPAEGIAAARKDRQNLLARFRARLVGETALTPPGLIVERGQTERDLNLLQRFFSTPSRAFRRWPALNRLVQHGIDAEIKQSKFIGRLHTEFDNIARRLNKAQFAELGDVLFRGDAEETEWSRDELVAEKVSPRVVEAYLATRKLIEKVGRIVDSHERSMLPKVRAQKAKVLRRMASMRNMDDAEFRKLYGRRARLQAKLRSGQGDPAALEVQIQAVEQELHAIREQMPEYIALMQEVDRLEARLAKTSVRRRTGYIPHKFFGTWRVFRLAGTDPETAEPQWEHIASEQGFFSTRSDAIRAASAFMEQNPDETLRVAPVEFKFPDSSATQLSDAAFWRFRRRVMDEVGVQGQELNDLMKGVARRRFRRRVAGFAQFRTGQAGYSRDLDRIVRAHIGEAVRYTMMDGLKFEAIETMEGMGLSPNRSANQENPTLSAAINAWWRDVNAQKQVAESQIDEILDRPWATPLRIGLAGGAAAFIATGGISASPLIGLFAGSYIGLRLYKTLEGAGTFKTRAITGAMLSDMAHLKLGAFFNVASAAVNMSQTVLNTFPVLGPEHTMAGLTRLGAAIASAAAGKPNKDFQLLKRADINPRMNFTETSPHLFKKESRLAFWSLFLFDKAESFNRGVAFLGAMNKADKAGKSHGDALRYAQGVLQRTQFHYGPSDKPELLRNVLLRVPLQFKNFLAHQIAFALGLDRKTELPLFMTSMFLTAGALGLPGLELLDFLLSLLFDWSPIEEIKETALRGLSQGSAVGSLVTLMARGIPGMLGMDITSRAGMGEKFLPSEPRDWTGPWWGTFDTAATLAQGSATIVDQLRNLSSGIGNPLKALEAAANGLPLMGTDPRTFLAALGDGESAMTNPYKRGRLEYEPSDSELLLKMIGFRPIREARMGDVRDITYAATDEYQADSARVIDRLVAALRARETGEANQILVEARDNGLYLTREQIKRALIAAQLPRTARLVDQTPVALRPMVAELAGNAETFGQ